jgi:hypothetical protein
MKKIQWKVSAVAVTLIVAAALLFAGCSDSDSGSSGSSGGGDGVLGQVAGVVYDNVTGTPVADVDVAIPGYTAVKSAADGSYLIKDVAVGTYTATFVKEGYGFTSRTVFVDPNAYTTIDPFREWDIVGKEFAVFQDWLKTVELPEAVNGATSNWTYSNGSFFNGDGAVTYNEATKKFEWSNKKLNYSYSHTVPLGLISLAPLNTSLKASIELVFAPYDNKATLSVPVKNVAPIADDIKVWLVDDSFVIGQEVGEAPKYDEDFDSVYSHAKYGPFLTSDGSFTADKLPARTKFTALIDKFSQEYEGSTFYFHNSVFYVAPVDAGNDLTKVEDFPLETYSGEEAVNAGKLYLFTEGDVAFVTATNVANPGAVLDVTDGITLTFNKAIDANLFSAYIDDVDSNTSATLAGGADQLPLKAVWNADKTVVTLTPNEKFTQYSGLKLPYSRIETTEIGTLTFSGKAADSSEIYAGGLPVYTLSELKMVSVEVQAPDESLARAYTVTKGGTVKLTFNKEVAVAPGSAFTFGVSPAHYRVDGNVIYVWVDTVFDTAVQLNYPAIYSNKESDDKIAAGNIAEISSKESKKLVLIGTNLYDNPKELKKGTPGNNANFALGSAIVLDFADIPAGSTVRAELQPSGTSVPVHSTATISSETKKVTITPARPLKANTTYRLKVLIENNGANIWDTPAVTTSFTYKDGANDGISFSTISTLEIRTSGTVGSKTNLVVTGGAPNTDFDANGDIYLDFDRPQKALGANAVKVIYTTTGKETPVTATLEDGSRILKISPARLLAPSASFRLRLNLESEDGQLYVRNADVNGNADDYATGTDYKTDISFSTAAGNRWGTGLKPTVLPTFALVTPPATVPKGDGTVPLRLANLAPSLVARDFSVHRTSYDELVPVAATTVPVTITVAKGATAPAANFTAELRGAPDHVDAENQIFYIRGVADDGTVIGGQVGPIDFAN